jgi:hypothetical protein
MESIEIGLNDLEPVSINLHKNDASSAPSSKVNFGPGIELLMNGKSRSAANENITLDLGDLDKLEEEMNELSANVQDKTSSSSGFGGFASKMFGMGDSNTRSVPIPDEPPASHLGEATRESIGNTKTWDGFSKMNDSTLSQSSGSSMNEREKRRKKRMMLKKLEEWYEKGQIKHNSHFNLDSPYDEIEDEYETAVEDKRKKEGIKLSGWWFMTFINSLEYANAVFNPFDLNLDGWGEQVSEDIDSYEEIFSELHDKYKGGKMAPEVSLLLRVGFSAAVLNFSNKALSTATPAFNDVIKQSPELMKMFTNATVSSMSNQSPGFAFANNLMQDNMAKPRGPPPPAAVDTQSQAPPPRPGMTFTEASSSRPDINAGRGTMFREQGVDIKKSYQDVNAPARSMPTPPPSRPEMRGPQSSDINNILSGLKTRTVNIHEKPADSANGGGEDDSLISIGSLKDMQGATMPTRSNRRKNKSDKNIISLDI